MEKLINPLFIDFKCIFIAITRFMKRLNNVSIKYKLLNNSLDILQFPVIYHVTVVTKNV